MLTRYTNAAYQKMKYALDFENTEKKYYKDKYQTLLRKHQKLILRESELEKAVDQYAHQIDHQNEMIANLLKERREIHQINASVDKPAWKTTILV